MTYSRQNNRSPPATMSFLVSRTCQLVTLHGKGTLQIYDQVKDLEMAAWLQIFSVTPGNGKGH